MSAEKNMKDNTSKEVLSDKSDKITGDKNEGFKYVFAYGSRDARYNKELSIQQKFFDLH